ncbi:uncharacterized protein LOC123874527 [Maniola jurtina]|uniref:uncharacterized protein LOC123874527 n=1 Tax=Maniola jurtina TaxID=191418 RepID=UPI001E6887DA|nr:uncharacterized protein LOC123874527 [Maniola jurtina]
MNELLQKHGCANVFSVPEGLKELMADISREVLRAQPCDINDFIANYLSVLLITREHGVMAVKILNDLCDCRPSVLEHLQQLGMDSTQAQALADIIKEEIEGSEEEQGKETVKEYLIVKKILSRQPLDEVMTAKVCQVARNAYRDYWYRKKTLEKGLKPKLDEPWEIAAEHTLELYKKTKPSFSELTRATEKIQAAYRGYHVRRNILRHLKPKSKKRGPKLELLGAPLDVGGSREIDLGPLIDIKVPEDNVNEMFVQHTNQVLGLGYDPMKTITHVPEEQAAKEPVESPICKDRPENKSTTQSQILGAKTRGMSAIQPQMLASSIINSRATAATPSQKDAPSVLELPKGRHLSEEFHPSHHKISFANFPPEVIQSIAEASLEIDAAEVPEDIAADDHSDTNGVNDSTASLPSSALSSANTTDVEDETGLITSGDEE